MTLSRMWIFLTNHTNRNPTRQPAAIPSRMETGTCHTMFQEKVPPVAIAVSEVNRTMTNTSSAEAPVMIMSGIPLSVPYPVSFSRSMRGTTTAGETAAMTQPRIAASGTASLRNRKPNRV